MKRKTCIKCGHSRSIDKFGTDKNSKDGLHSHCKLCRRISDKSREHTVGRRFSNYKKRAKKDGLNFEINVEDFKSITIKSCIYCGGFSISSSDKFCGIDRMDSNKGYIKTNIVPCCNICNIMKGILTYDEFTSHIGKIFSHIADKE